jgi:succinoglycan biosynthesis protein ExoM
MTADIDIAICTFRRTHIVETIQSVGQISQPEDLSIRIIVVDNDDVPSAKERVNSCDVPFDITYVHASGRNISIARNACLDAATAPIVVFIDDDELVTKDWLKCLFEEQKRSNSDVVLGPANAVYGKDAPKWMQQGDHHSTSADYVDGEIRSGYVGNTLLMRNSPAVSGLRFRLDLGRSGGEDTVFVSCIHQRGGKISYAPGAIVTEAVPPQRATLGWLLRRKFRFGQTHGLMLKEGILGKRVKPIRDVPIAFGKGLSCLCMAILTAPIIEKSASWLLRGTLHAGVIYELLGGRAQELYGTDQPI